MIERTSDHLYMQTGAPKALIFWTLHPVHIPLATWQLCILIAQNPGIPKYPGERPVLDAEKGSCCCTENCVCTST